MYLNLYFYLIMFVISIFLYSYLYSQLLLTLMSLEFIMLSLLMLMISLMYNQNYLLILYYLVFVVCEGVLGLTLLIMMIRSLGNDNMNWLNLILW